MCIFLEAYNVSFRLTNFIDNPWTTLIEGKSVFTCVGVSLWSSQTFSQYIVRSHVYLVVRLEQVVNMSVMTYWCKGLYNGIRSNTIHIFTDFALWHANFNLTFKLFDLLSMFVFLVLKFLAKSLYLLFKLINLLHLCFRGWLKCLDFSIEARLGLFELVTELVCTLLNDLSEFLSFVHKLWLANIN